MEVRYRPGQWVAVTGPRTWLLVAAAADAPLVARCWQLARTGADELELLNALVAEGLRAVRGFAVAGYADGVGQVVVRGEVTVTAVDADGTERVVTAEGMATWVESRLTGSLARLLFTGPVADGPALPLDSGVVHAGALEIIVGQRLAGVRAEQADTPIEPVSDAVAHDHLFGAEPDPIPIEPDPIPVEPDPIPVEKPAPIPVSADKPAESRSEPAPEIGNTTLLTPVPAIPEGTTNVITHLAWAVADDPGATRMRATGPSAPPTPMVVLAIRCESGHWNPPHALSCRVCGSGVPPQQPIEVPRPSLGVLRLTTGDLVQLDRGVLLGRQPDTAAVDQPVRPHVVRLRSPLGDISRNHVEVRLHGWQVLVADLGSRNGTVVCPPADLPFDLVARQPVEIQPGTVVNLATDIGFVFEVTG